MLKMGSRKNKEFFYFVCTLCIGVISSCYFRDGLGHKIIVNNYANHTLPLKVIKANDAENTINLNPGKRYRCNSQDIENIFIDGRDLVVLDANYYGVESIDFDVSTDGKQWEIKPAVDRYKKDKYKKKRIRS